jgi:hypothetical protein
LYGVEIGSLKEMGLEFGTRMFPREEGEVGKKRAGKVASLDCAGGA